MTTIQLKTVINAPVEIVFDLSRSIDFHMQSASNTNEKAISGRTSGMINPNETVTWRGKHFGIYVTHQSIISSYQRPDFFVDEMVTGHFKSFRHQHIFKTSNHTTEMTDILHYQTPLGVLGKIFDTLILKNTLPNSLRQEMKLSKSKQKSNNQNISL